MRTIGIRDGHVVAVSRDDLDGRLTDIVGTTRTGRFLRVAHRSPAQPTQRGELASVS